MPDTVTTVERSERRAGDRDRDRAFELLRRAAGEGQLDVPELEERLDTAAAAKTHGELRALTADLSLRSRGRHPRRDGRAKARAEAAVYVRVMALLVLIWALTGFGYFWPAWPMLGWGIPLALRVRPWSFAGRRALAARPGS
jgi:hypothetical protein